MKKILFLLFFPTLLFSQRKIRYINKADTVFINIKWQHKTINLDSLYYDFDVVIAPPIRDNDMGLNMRGWCYFDKNQNIERCYSFIEALGIGERDKNDDGYSIIKDIPSFGGSTFRGGAAFEGTKFSEGIISETTKFLDYTSFSHCIFDNEANFNEAYFKDKRLGDDHNKLFDGTVNYRTVNYSDSLSTVVFSKCKFLSLTMEKAIFDSSVDFIFALFRRTANFSGCKFNKNVFFTKSQFNDEIYFDKVQFSGETNFKDVQFKDRVFFVESVFRGITAWDKAIFNITADFSKTTFKQTPSFDKTQLPFYLYLTNLNLKEINVPIRFDLALTDSLQKRWGNGQKCHIFLNTFTDISKIVLDASKFELVFDSTMKHDDKISVFEQVIKKCKEIGFGESTKGFDIELQKLQLHHGYPILGSALIWLNEYWWNFGYEKSKIFRNTGFAFLLSFLIFFFRLPDYARVYFPSQMGISDEMASKLHLFTWMRFRVALFYTALIFFTWKMEHGEVNYRNYPLKTLIIYTVFTVGIIHLAYLAGAVISR